MAPRADKFVRGERGGGMGGHHGADVQSVEWYTPPGIFDALGLVFDLDPCSPAGGLPWVPAAAHIALPDDGLASEWCGRVWLNPPYGPHTGTWMRRLAAHPGGGLALVFARTETAWWQDTVGSATAVCFIAGRLTFVDRDRRPGKFNAGAPSALVAFGEECAVAVQDAALGMTFRCSGVALEGQGSLWEQVV